MFNSARRSYTMEDAGGSYCWMVDGLDMVDYQAMTDEEIYEWVDEMIETAKENAKYRLGEEEMPYPRYGYTTAQVFESAEEYHAFKMAEIESDLSEEREPVFQFLKDWIAEGENE